MSTGINTNNVERTLWLNFVLLSKIIAKTIGELKRIAARKLSVLVDKEKERNILDRISILKPLDTLLNR